MPKRRTQKQSAHDQKVRQIARKHKSGGWDVQADLKGLTRPAPIGRGKYIPDIVARKAGAKRIIEVETPDTLEKDKDQQATFRRSAGQQSRTTFEVIVTKKTK